MTTRKDRVIDLDDLNVNMQELEQLATACAVRAGIHRQRVLIEKSEEDQEIAAAYEEAVAIFQQVFEGLKPVRERLKDLVPPRRFFGLFSGSKA